MAWFWLRGQLSGEHRWRALGALVLGGCQGLLGWYMVRSGLVDEPAVSHFLLAARSTWHFSWRLHHRLGVYLEGQAAASRRASPSRKATL